MNDESDSLPLDGRVDQGQIRHPDNLPEPIDSGPTPSKLDGWPWNAIKPGREYTWHPSLPRFAYRDRDNGKPTWTSLSAA